MKPIPISLAVEDVLSEIVLRRLIGDVSTSGKSFHIGSAYGKRGFGYLRSKINGWNAAARSTPILVLTDLDDAPCPASLVQNWLVKPKHANLLFRVAVREVEAWLIADFEGLRTYLRSPRAAEITDPESLDDAKATLIDIARSSRSAEIKRAIVPKSNGTAKQGPLYNDAVGTFAGQFWDVATARRHSPSLDRTVRRLEEFEPIWER